MIKKVRRFVRKISGEINSISLSWLLLKYNYFNVNIYYSKGTSLIENMKKNKLKVYEESTCEILTKALRTNENPVFIDIGANIGLISIYLLHHVPNLKIHAFEPGPHQYNLFSKTIRNNKIGQKIELMNIALSNTEGTAEFCVHASKDVSGDGLIDTNRAGSTKKIQVQVKKLDDWWHEVGEPAIDVIKIDTEGAELWVLEGAAELINTCKPKILTEICMQNYNNYPYNEFDIIKYLKQINYLVYNEDMVEITDKNLNHFQDLHQISYLCLPTI